MKKIVARIAMSIEVTDEEFEALRGQGDITLEGELLNRFQTQGKFAGWDSYIPEAWLDEAN